MAGVAGGCWARSAAGGTLWREEHQREGQRRREECIVGGAGPEGRTHRHRPRWLGLVVWRWRDERDWRIVDWRSSSFFGGRRLKKRANDVHLVELRVHLESFSLCGALSPEF